MVDNVGFAAMDTRGWHGNRFHVITPGITSCQRKQHSLSKRRFKRKPVTSVRETLIHQIVRHVSVAITSTKTSSFTLAFKANVVRIFDTEVRISSSCFFFFHISLVDFLKTTKCNTTIAICRKREAHYVARSQSGFIRHNKRVYTCCYYGRARRKNFCGLKLHGNDANGSIQWKITH